MAKLDELIERMRKNPNDVRFAEACAVADAFFGPPRQHATSHRLWKMPWAGDPRVNMQGGKDGKAKAYQVQQLLKAIDRWHTEQGKKTEQTKGATLSTVATGKRKSTTKR